MKRNSFTSLTAMLLAVVLVMGVLPAQAQAPKSSSAIQQ